jgi:type II secretion system protein I
VTGGGTGCREAGFTLLETLVALAILGIVMSTVYAVIGSGLRTAHRDEDRLLLGLVAQNLLARSRLDLDPGRGALSGDIGGGLRWRIESEPYEVPNDILPDAPRGLDEPRLPPRDGEEGSATATSGLGARAANAGETAAGARGEAGGPAEEDRPGSDAGIGDRQEPRPQVSLRLLRVVVEKGDQRYELSTLAVEAPLVPSGAL